MIEDQLHLYFIDKQLYILHINIKMRLITKPFLSRNMINIENKLYFKLIK